MAILKCCECNRYFHKNRERKGCIFCGSIKIQYIDYVESSNNEALMHYKNGEMCLEHREYDKAVEQFYMALRYDEKCSEAYWMGYLALNKVLEDIDLLYSGNINRTSSCVRNALKYADEITRLVYEEILEVDNFYEKKLKVINERMIDAQIVAIVKNSEYDTLVKNINDLCEKIKAEKVLLIKSYHKQINYEWKIRQKYANIEYSQMKLCKKIIDKYMDRGYEVVATKDEDIITLSAIEKYQDYINVNQIENDCKTCKENIVVQQEIQNRKKIEETIKTYKEELQKVKMLLKIKFKEVEKVENSLWTSLLFQKKQLYVGIDNKLSILDNYLLIDKKAK